MPDNMNQHTFGLRYPDGAEVVAGNGLRALADEYAYALWRSAEGSSLFADAEPVVRVGTSDADASWEVLGDVLSDEQVAGWLAVLADAQNDVEIQYA